MTNDKRNMENGKFPHSPLPTPHSPLPIPFLPFKLKMYARCELERARPACAEHASGGLQRRAEAGAQRVLEAGEVGVVHSADVRHVEEVERLGDGLNVQSLAELQALGQTQVERLEAVAKLQVIWRQRQRTSRERLGVVLVDEGVQLRACAELAAAGVALNDRNARPAARQSNVDRHVRGQRVDRRNLES